VFEDGGLPERAVFSYRACIVDVDQTRVAANVTEPATTRGCSVTDTHVQTLSGVLAAVQDAWWRRFGFREARAPVALTFARGIVPGDNLRLTSASGNTICRLTTSGNIGCETPCPLRWKLFFHDAAGEVILGVPDELSDYAGGVLVPAGATRISVGYRDEELFNCANPGKCCTTGQTCEREDLYFDNEGNRTPNSASLSRSTGGCTFAFELEGLTCD
jgi:hypothetical protein